MPQAVFVLHLDDYKGFIVAKRYPATFSLNEKTLNLVFFEHGDAKETALKLADIDGKRVAIYGTQDHSRWLVCFVLGPDEDFHSESDVLSGMGKLILELVVQSPDLVDIGEILRRRSVIEDANEEQAGANLMLIPSAGLILEKMQSEGATRARNLEMWLRNQIQAEDIQLRNVVTSMMQAGVLKVELVGRDEKADPPKSGIETVFMIKDVFGYRSPPCDSLEKCQETRPDMYPRYRQYVEGFFANYKPTAPADDSISSHVEDRTKIARLVSQSLEYTILKQLREQPLTVAEIADRTLLPEQVVRTRMWNLESVRVAAYFEEEGVWALVSNPVFETFMPEYVLPVIVKKHTEEQLDTLTAMRYLELLIETWGEVND